MGQFNHITMQRVVRGYPEPYYTRTGRTYIAERVFDKNRKVLGHIVWAYDNDVENETPKFVKFILKGHEFKYSSLNRYF